MKLTFCGAAQIVTGSCYLIETGGEKYLVDCGMFQGPKHITRLNYKRFPFNPKEISHVFLTHAHIDHSGLLPKLVAQGFSGKICATAATIDLCEIMLQDSAHIQEMDTEQENRRRVRQGKEPREPLYTQKHAEQIRHFFKEVNYGEDLKISSNVIVTFRDAGHILGSAIIEFCAEGKKIVFSGDLGQWNVPIVQDPTLIEDANYLLIESTYGNRLHEPIQMRQDLLLKVVEKTHKKGGKLLIPTFAIERTQELLYAFNKLVEAKKFPDQKIFLDSPLAIKATEIFKKHHECFDKAAANTKSPFTFPQLEYSLKTKDSIKLNTYSEPCIIMAGSGMCTGGRIRHHLKHGLWEPKNTILFVGYQAEHTLGRVILEGAEKIWMMGLTIVVKADVEKINSFSAHADYNELLKWSRGFKKKPYKTFVVHGEPDASSALKQRLEKEGHDCYIPSLGETIVL